MFLTKKHELKSKAHSSIDQRVNLRIEVVKLKCKVLLTIT